MKGVVERQEHLDLKQGVVVDLLLAGDRVAGVKTRDGLDFKGRSVVLTTGTFLRGLIHIGLNSYPGGRAGEPASEGLSEVLRGLGLTVGRLKTGTPARLSARSIDFSRLEKQSGDAIIKPFSFMTEGIERKQVDCFIAHTNNKTHQVIRENIKKSALFAGVIEGIGPRYCPSIEDKVMRFPDKDSHQSFLEPEGRDSAEMYPSGLSTSLPPDVQLQYFRTMVGFASVEIMRPGYAIEYDFVEPNQLRSTLETRVLRGLFHAGQINGTSGYEEAAAQGLLAGINAAQSCRGAEPLLVGREQGYLGVMVDDLVTQPTLEPYRMFTSRSEYRLILREDNADQRLTGLGRSLGLVSDERWERFQEKQRQVESGRQILQQETVKPSDVATILALGLAELKSGVSLEVLLRRPQIDIEQLVSVCPALGALSTPALEQLEIAVKYAGYIKRQIEQVERFREQEGVALPEGVDFYAIESLSSEVREKLSRVRPATLGQASRVPGVTPAAIAVLQIYLRKFRHG
jgi:tRNA uridine 5-carboxymethylaminomethyl modification enzyme